ncbi:heparinase II/III family protein [Cellulosimicrobium cellulans]|uniref:heparinase II/III domain-containing protein n=1 Tax=Cellulosimicrobium cellulans TaxID=1710 RepID=UPI0036627141
MGTVDRAREVALRQAFGVGFEATAQDAALADDARARTLRLAPHPDFSFPSGIDWHADPFSQRNWRAQLHMLRWLDPVRRQAQVGRWAEFQAWEEIVHDWIAANSDPARTIVWAWKDMVDAVRAEVLLYGVPFARDTGILMDALALHRDWLIDPGNLGHSNHALHQHSALFQLGRALGDDAAVRVSVARLREYFESNYDDQGLNAEGAPGYWELNLRWGREVLERLVREGQEASFIAASLKLTAESIAHATRPDGRLEALGDTVAGRPRAGQDDVIEYVRSQGEHGAPPASTSKLYLGGYAFGRSGWGETRRSVDEESFYSLVFGRSDKVHGHVDAGSFTFFAGRSPLVVDGGKFSYTNTPERAHFVSRAAHNVVVIRGATYDKTTAVELARHESNEIYDYFRLEDGGYDGVALRRDFLYLRPADALLIIDTVVADREVDAELRFLLDPRRAVEQRTGYVLAGDGGISFGGTLPEIRLIGAAPTDHDGWVSERWNERTPSHVVTARKSGRRFRFVTAVSGSRPSGRLRSVELDEGTRAFRVESPTGAYDVVIGEASVRVERSDQPGGSVGPAADAPDTELVAEMEALVARVRGLLAADSDRYHEESRDLDLLRLREVIALGHDHGALVTARDLRVAGIFAGEAPDSLGERIRGPYPYFRPSTESAGDVVLHGRRFDAGLARSEAATHVVEVGALALPVRVDPRNSETMIVGFSGALERARDLLPRFERARGLGGFGRTTAVVSDPTLDLRDDLGLAWYLGTLTRDLHADIADVLQRIASSVGASRVLLVGSSGGGFAALQVGSFMPRSHVVAINPQTDVRRYHARFSEKALELVSGDPRGLPLAGSRLSAIERLRQGRSAERVTLVVNRGDGHHVTSHVRPFVSAAKQAGVRVDVREVDWGRGHVGPNADAFSVIVNEALAKLEG